MLSSVSVLSIPSLMALWMCIPGAFFPLLIQAALCFIIVIFVVVKCSPCSHCQRYFVISVLLFKLMAVHFALSSSLTTCLFFHPIFFFLLNIHFFSLFFHMHGETLQKGQHRPGRKICTFSIFVLCTALLILNPIIYYLNPLQKKKKSPRAFTLCVCK